MPKQVAAQSAEIEEVQKVHPLQKSYTLVSKKHVNYNDLTTFEAVSMSAVAVLAILVGVLQSTTIV